MSARWAPSAPRAAKRGGAKFGIAADPATLRRVRAKRYRLIALLSAGVLAAVAGAAVGGREHAERPSDPPLAGSDGRSSPALATDEPGALTGERPAPPA